VDIKGDMIAVWYYTDYTSARAAHAAYVVDMESVLLDDIKNIQKRHTTFQSHQQMYGKIWDFFQQALTEEGFYYWGRLYQDIFDKSFKLDKEALIRRMNVPKEIREQGAEAVANYLEELEQKGAKHLNEARIIILGEKGAGKTCLARRLKNPVDKLENIESTPGVETTLWELEKDNINVHIWDFAGHVVTHAAHQFFLSERCLYILVYDGRTENRNQLDYWLNHAKNYGKESKVFILVNRWKEDPHTPSIPINSLIKDKKYPIVGVYTFSIRDDFNELEDFRTVVAGYIKNNPSWNNQVLPSNYFNVKKELEELFAGNKKEEYIDIAKFSKIAKRNKVDDIDRLLRNLHALGICLRYENMEDFDTLVLNPEWISYGIYKIINWMHNGGKHSIVVSDFSIVFGNDDDDARYPKDKHRFLFELMIRYELAYETKEKKCLIIPHLLHEDRPKTLPDFPVGESLMLRYIAEQPLPLNTISRFIVRHNEEIKKEGEEFLVWRYGVVLKDENDSIALVREDKEKHIITVSVKGNKKTGYIDVLRSSLNEIFDKYQSWNSELQYRIDSFGQINEGRGKENPIWLSEDIINGYIARKRSHYDVLSNREIPIPPVVQNFNITGGNVNVGAGGTIHDESVRNTFNFYDCNIGIQRSLDELSGLLKRKGEIEEAEELEEIIDTLTEAEQCKKPDEIKKKGFINKMQRFFKNLENENTNLHRAVKIVKNGVSIAQDIAKGYNEIAQWVGFPQVPKPFLKKE